MDVIITRCAGLDVHRATAIAKVRVLDDPGGRRVVTETFGAMTPDLLALRDWLQAFEVVQVRDDFWRGLPKSECLERIVLLGDQQPPDRPASRARLRVAIRAFASLSRRTSAPGSGQRTHRAHDNRDRNRPDQVFASASGGLLKFFYREAA
jgi:hypothetical protein